MKDFFVGFIATALAVSASTLPASASSQSRPAQAATPQTDGSGVCSTSGCVVTICDKNGSCTTYWCANNQACVKVSASRR